MPVTGELIRSLNYVDDITSTLRRIHISIPQMSAEERKEIAASMRKAQPNYQTVLDELEKSK